MQKGISVYAGLGYSVQENLDLIEFASSLNMKYLFTSAQIPEAADSENFFEELLSILTAATNKKFEIILDVSSEDAPLFNVEELTLRLDDGFDTPRIAELSQTRKIQLNASTVTEDFLTELKNCNANFNNTTALHNFYPRPETGLDSYFFINQNKILHDYGIGVGAFIPSRDGKRRPPIGEGLPTLEDCRNFTADLSARYLAALGTDFIIIGDGMPTFQECESVSKISADEVVITAQMTTDDEIAKEILSKTFTRRPDVSKSVIRAIEGRQILKSLGTQITPDVSPKNRTFGDVTIDNSNYGRYAGEVQIIDAELPADSRVNVAAHIIDEEFFLTRYIKPRQKFSFRLI
ncbi:MAG: DUF871 domain-containing protein [Selenomonadaceae bacterium]|nr:DUF871 domain-containing protein [Selenomonadaceae bacterium]MBQ7629269.1 DUF871 domain-containing protein [Selenomonadaceae bacterium]